SHKPYFEAILQVLSEIRCDGLRYRVEWAVLDTKHFGVPHSRPRVWIVMVRSDVLGGRSLVWPSPHVEPCRTIDELLDDKAAPRGHPPAAPPKKDTVAYRNCILMMGALAQAGKEPFKHTYVLDIDGSAPSTPMLGCSPCLTATRASGGGHWLSTRGRRMSTAEMCKLQGMDPARLRAPNDVSEFQFRKMLGNSMSVNVVETLLVMLNKAAPEVMHVTSPLHDRWSAHRGG
ncbi:MAG: DNA cytosine methyltransferase, partial [bacterium]|nr:DNA cytosine methyltransferase [bacterium]